MVSVKTFIYYNWYWFYFKQRVMKSHKVVIVMCGRGCTSCLIIDQVQAR